jgi:ribonuclease T2
MKIIKKIESYYIIRMAFRALFAGVCAIVAAGTSSQSATAQGDRGGAPGDFDYYILTLSWSPTYCQSKAERNDDEYDRDGGYGSRRGYDGGLGDSGEQCNGVRPYAFVLHGLWPQYERRGWPEMCRTRERPWVDRDLINKMLDIMPSPKLVIQEYRKHGTCSGLSPSEYFETARRLYRSVRIPERFTQLSEPVSVPPEDIKQAILGANPQLSPDMIQITCSRNLLRDVRICFTKDFNPRSCSQNELNRRLCPSGSVTLPPVRGGGTGPRGGPSPSDL